MKTRHISSKYYSPVEADSLITRSITMSATGVLNQQSDSVIKWQKDDVRMG